MTTLFLSYRRTDSADSTGRIVDWLTPRFGRKSLFFDIDAIPPGIDFPTYISDWLRRTDVMLLIIGPTWLTVRDPDQISRRLDDPNDVVHVEIATALKLGISIIPVLIGGASLPAAEELPDSLRPIAALQPVIIRRNPSFSNDMGHLFDAIMTLQYKDDPRSLWETLLAHWQEPRSRIILFSIVASFVLAMILTWTVILVNSNAGATEVGNFDASTVIAALKLLGALLCLGLGIATALLLPKYPQTQRYGRTLQIVDIALVALLSLPLLLRFFQLIPSVTTFFGIVFGGYVDLSITIPNIDVFSISIVPISTEQYVVMPISLLAIVVILSLVRKVELALTAISAFAASIVLSGQSWLQYLQIYQYGDPDWPLIHLGVAPHRLDWEHLPQVVSIATEPSQRVALVLIFGSVLVLLIVGIVQLVVALFMRRWWWAVGLVAIGSTQFIVWQISQRDSVLNTTIDTTDSHTAFLIYSTFLILALVAWPCLVVLSTIYLQRQKTPTETRT